MRHGTAPVLLLLAVLLAGCGGDSTKELSKAQLQSIVDGLTQDTFTGKGLGAKQLFHIPGSALTVQGPDAGARSVAGGISDITADVPYATDQVQAIGSNTKVVTATLVMQLVEQGKINPDDRLTAVAERYDGDGGALRTLVAEHQARLQEIELHELLDHTSGLFDCLDSNAFGRALEREPLREFTLPELAGFGLAQKPVFSPGAPGKWNYSNTDYMLLGMVIEAVTGRPVEDSMTALFKQAGMKNTYYAPSTAELSELEGEGRLVHGYMPPSPGLTLPPIIKALDGTPVVEEAVEAPPNVKAISTNPSQSGPTVQVTEATGPAAKRAAESRRFKFQDVTNAYSFSFAGPAGGLASNTEDLAAFWRALFDGTLVSKETLDQMQRTVPTGENSKGVEVTWGFGFGHQQIAPGVLFEGSPELSVWYHAGNIFGYSSIAYYVEQVDLVVANTVNIFPQPVGDFGVLRDVLSTRAEL